MSTRPKLQVSAPIVRRVTACLLRVHLRHCDEEHPELGHQDIRRLAGEGQTSSQRQNRQDDTAIHVFRCCHSEPACVNRGSVQVHAFAAPLRLEFPNQLHQRRDDCVKDLAPFLHRGEGRIAYHAAAAEPGPMVHVENR